MADQRRHWWLGTIIAVLSLIVSVLAWQLPVESDPPPVADGSSRSVTDPSPEPSGADPGPPGQEPSEEPVEEPSGEPAEKPSFEDPPDATDTPEAPVNDVPEVLLGTWQGYATSPTAGSFGVQAHLQGGGRGEYIGWYLVPVAGCRSDIIMEDGDGDWVDATVQVKTGACYSGRVRFSVFGVGMRVESIDGSGVVGYLQRS